MTCLCRSPAEHESRAIQSYADSARSEKEYYEKQIADLKRASPDNTKYEIVEIVRISEHVVLKVLYPNCSKCSYEGNKVMVFLNVSETQLVKWRSIDPHFREGSSTDREAPSPTARFPASVEGWDDAIQYARSKVGRRTR